MILYPLDPIVFSLIKGIIKIIIVINYWSTHWQMIDLDEISIIYVLA